MGTDDWHTPSGEAVDNSWNAGGAAPVSANGWQADGHAGDEHPAGGFSRDNISKHADAPRDGGCRSCGDEGHFARDCPEPRAEPGRGGLTGECYNCGEVGHNKADCPNPRVEREFTGECRNCGHVGHRRADCPHAPGPKCRVCGDEGHAATECGANRVHEMFKALGIPEMSPEEAWDAIEDADEAKDVDDIKKAIFAYAQAYPELTFGELEQTFRDAGMNTHIIAKEKPVADTQTIVNLQGEAGQKYAVSYQFSGKPKRAKFAEGWPSSGKENRARLAQAGVVMDGLVQKCRNCNELGHISRDCPEEKTEVARVAITCANCNEEGHRARDCTQERKSAKRGCKNCGSEEHMVKECPEPRMDLECNECGEKGHMSRTCPAKGPDVCHNCGDEGHHKNDCVNERRVQCRNCDQWGHSGQECPEPRDVTKVQCHNCDEFGHIGRDCSKPTDWTKVECTSCQQKGHSYKRCPQLTDKAGGDGGWGKGGDASGGGGGDASGGGGGQGDGWGDNTPPAGGW